MTKIIISYRRADADVFAGRVRDRIASRYGEDSVFIDVDNIPFGKDFRVHIQEVMGKADAVLVVIGPKWLGPGQAGHDRIMEPTDPCRIEVETALSKNILTIPVLVGSTPMPKPEQLPESLKNFAFINAAPIDTGRDFHRDLTRVIVAINEIIRVPMNTAERAAIAGDGAVERASPSLALAGVTQVEPKARDTTHARAVASAASPIPGRLWPTILAVIAGTAVIAAVPVWLLLSADNNKVPHPAADALLSAPATTSQAAAERAVSAPVVAPSVPTVTVAPAPAVRALAPSSAPSLAAADPGAAVVTAFFTALGRGDGAAAAARVVPEKRKDNYDPQKMTATYSKFSTQLRLISVVASGANTYQATYTYQTSPTNSACMTTATINVTERDGQYFIQSIRASC